jgi:hypothetical protein
VVEEFAIRFNHPTPIDWLLAGVAPTGRKVEMAVVVIVGFRVGSFSRDPIYWNQAGGAGAGWPAESRRPAGVWRRKRPQGRRFQAARPRVLIHCPSATTASDGDKAGLAAVHGKSCN